MYTSFSNLIKNKIRNKRRFSIICIQFKTQIMELHSVTVQFYYSFQYKTTNIIQFSFNLFPKGNERIVDRVSPDCIKTHYNCIAWDFLPLETHSTQNFYIILFFLFFRRTSSGDATRKQEHSAIVSLATRHRCI